MPRYSLPRGSRQMTPERLSAERLSAWGLGPGACGLRSLTPHASRLTPLLEEPPATCRMPPDSLTASRVTGRGRAPILRGEARRIAPHFFFFMLVEELEEELEEEREEDFIVFFIVFFIGSFDTSFSAPAAARSLSASFLSASCCFLSSIFFCFFIFRAIFSVLAVSFFVSFLEMKPFMWAIWVSGSCTAANL